MTKTLIVPGLDGSPAPHWQHWWAATDPTALMVDLSDPSRPVPAIWEIELASMILRHPDSLLVGHSLGAVLFARLLTNWPHLRVRGHFWSLRPRPRAMTGSASSVKSPRRGWIFRQRWSIWGTPAISTWPRALAPGPKARRCTTGCLRKRRIGLLARAMTKGSRYEIHPPPNLSGPLGLPRPDHLRRHLRRSPDPCARARTSQVGNGNRLGSGVRIAA